MKRLCHLSAMGTLGVTSTASPASNINQYQQKAWRPGEHHFFVPRPNPRRRLQPASVNGWLGGNVSSSCSQLKPPSYHQQGNISVSIPTLPLCEPMSKAYRCMVRPWLGRVSIRLFRRRVHQQHKAAFEDPAGVILLGLSSLLDEETMAPPLAVCCVRCTRPTPHEDLPYLGKWTVFVMA